MSQLTWLTDANGNRASIEYWGSEEAAKAALESLKRCWDCSDCSYCFDCSRCSNCSDCSDCSNCSGCSNCSYCFDCSRCSDMTPQKVVTEVPAIENIHQSLLAAIQQEDCTLDMTDWHSCETTHCRAGWVVHLAGKAGYDLERRTSTAFAAQQIYKASGYLISPVRFHEDDETAMADIVKCAEQEKLASK